MNKMNLYGFNVDEKYKTNGKLAMKKIKENK